MKSKFETTLENMKPKKLTEKEKKILWSRVEGHIQPKVRTATTKGTTHTQIPFWQVFSTFNYSRYVLVPVLIFAFLAGSISTTAVFADNSQPGDFLFPFDIAAEKILLTITFGDTEDSLRLRFAEERIDEVKAILSLASSVEINSGSASGTSTDNGVVDTTPTEETENDESDNNANGATSTNDTNGSSTNANDVDLVDLIDTTKNALIFALAQLEEAKTLFASQGNASGVAAVNSFIAELAGLAENHITQLDRVSVTISNNGNDTAKIQVRASSKELKTKFRFTKETDGNGNTKQRVALSNANSNSSLKIDNDGGFKFNFKFRGKKNNVENDENDHGDDDDNDHDEDGHDDDDGDEDGDSDGKKDKKVFVCHKGKNTLHISKNARWAHVLHGDRLGRCDEDGGGSGDGDDDDDDTTAPILSGVASQPATTTAEIRWSTDENATGQVWYSSVSPVTTNSPALSVQTDTLTEDHSFILSSLTASTTYYYMIVSRDASFNFATSSEQSFITLSDSVPPDTTVPTISNIVATAATTSAQVLWDTDEDSNSVIYFDTTTPIDPDTAFKVESASLITSHSLALSNLTASTTYHYIVTSTDGAGNIATSTENLFETLTQAEPLDTTPPTLSNIVANATTTEATITWDTDEDADSAVWYGTTTPLVLIEAQSQRGL